MAEHYSMCATSKCSTQQGLLAFSLLVSLNVFVVSEHVHPSPSIPIFKLFLKPEATFQNVASIAISWSACVFLMLPSTMSLVPGKNMDDTVNSLLEYVGSKGYAKIQALVPVDTHAHIECSNVSVWVLIQLMVPVLKSSLLNTLASFRSLMSSLIVGVGCLSLYGFVSFAHVYTV